MIAPELPTITYGLRGLAYFELRLRGPSHDLHSGMFGGVVHNPAQVLCELIAAMHDASGRVTLPGFYDRVRPLDAEERRELGPPAHGRGLLPASLRGARPVGRGAGLHALRAGGRPAPPWR